VDQMNNQKVTNVLIVGMTANAGGIEALMRSIVPCCDPTVVHFDFLSNEPSIAFEAEFKALGCKSYHITARRESRSKFYRELRDFFEKHAAKYDVIWENQNSAANIDYLVYAKRYGIPKRIIHCHNAKNGEGFVRGVLHALNRPALPSIATDFWTVSDESSVWFFGKDYKKLPGYHVFSNAIDVDAPRFDEAARMECRKRIGISDNSVVILNVGRLVPQKNQSVVLACAAELARRGEDVITLVAGEGELRGELEEQAKELDIQKRVKLLGMVDNVSELYSASDVLLMPSLFEGLSIALLEAQANGIPIVTSSVIVERALVNANIVRVDAGEKSPLPWADAVENALSMGRVDGTALHGSEFDIKTQVENIQGLLTS
jgi:glycosyltransferase involved in cell wall biosynthesis